MADSVAQLQQQILALTGVNIMADADTFKSTFQILQEISEVWDDLTDVSKANVLNLLGGKRNANVLSSLISNFGDAQKAMATASNSAGSALAENEKYLNSIEGKTKQLKASFETMANAIVNSDLVKTWIDIQRAIADAVTWLQKFGLLLPTITAATAAVKAFQTASVAQKAAGGIIDLLRRGGETTEIIKSVESAIGSLGAFGGRLAGATVLDALKNMSIDESLRTSIKGIMTTATQATPRLLTLSGAFDMLKTKAAGAGAILKSVFQSTLGKVGIGITAGIALFKLATSAYENYINGLIDGAEKAWSAHTEVAENATANKEALAGIADEFNTLKEGVDRYGNNISLTDDEYARYLDLCKQIINITPSLKHSYNEKGSSLKTGYITVLDEAIAKQQEFLDNDAKTTVAQAPQVIAGWSAELNKDRSGVTTSTQKLVSDVIGLHSDGAERAGEIWRNALSEIGAIDLFDTDGYRESVNFDAVYKMLDNWETIVQRFREAGYAPEAVSQLQTMIGPLKSFYDTYQDKLEKIVDLFQLASSYLDQTKSLWDVVAAEGQTDVFERGLFSVLSPDGTYEENLAATTDYLNQMVFAIYEINDLRKQLAEGEGIDIESAWEELYEKFGKYPAIIGMIRDALFGSTQASEENADAVNNQIQSYENLEKILSKISGFNSFLNKARNGSGADDPFGMISSAKDVADAYNEIVAVSEDIPKIDWTSMVEGVGPNGEITWGTASIEGYIDVIINAATANTEFANSHPEVIAWLQQMAKGLDDTAAAAKSLSDAMSSMESIDGIIKRINEYNGDDSEAFDIINELQKFVDEWNKIREEQQLEPIDITTFVSEENGKISFSNTVAALGEFRDAIINDNEAMQELKTTSPGLYSVITTMGTQAVDAASDILTLGDAISSLSDVTKYMSEGFGDDTLNAISNASKLADEWNKALKDAGRSDEANKSFRDFISFDADGNVIEDAEKQTEALRKMYTDIATAAIDLDDTLTRTEKMHLKSAIPAWVEQWLNVDEVKKRVEEIKDAFSEIKDITSYQNDLASYRSGDIEYFDMLEKMYNLASQYEDINLGDLWDFEVGDFKDIGDIQLDKMLDKLAVELKVSGEEIEDWKTKVKNSFKEAEEAANAYETATKSINLASSLNGFLGDVKSGDKDPLSMLSSAISLAEDLGVKLEDVISVGAGGKLSYNTKALTDAFNQYIDKLVDGKELNAELAAEIKKAATAEGELAEEAKGFNEVIADALSNMQSLYSFMQSGTAGDSDILTVLKSAQEQFKAYQDMVKDGLETTPLDIFSFITVDSSKIKENVDTAKKLYTDVADQMVNEWIAETKKANAGRSGLTLLTGEEEWTNGLTAEQAAWFGQIKTQILEHLKDLDAEIEPTIGDIIGNLQSLFDFRNKIASGESVDFSTVYDDLEKLRTVLGDETINLGDIIKWEDGDFRYVFNNTDLLNQKIDEFATTIATDLVDAEIQAGTAMEGALRDEEIRRRADAIKDSLTGVVDAWTELNNTTSKIKSFQGLRGEYQSYQNGETSFLDMLSSTLSMAEDLGMSLDEAFTIGSDGEMVVNIENMENGLIGVIDNLEASGLASANLANQLREAARAEIDLASGASKVQTAYEKFNDAVGFGNGRSRAQQLTYNDYKSMIERDARYAESVEYVNGIMSVNVDAYNQVTEAIAKETVQMALLEAAQRKLKIDEYQRELKENKSLTDAQRASIDKEIKKLAMEAKGYTILANEISNATNQFERFRNAAGEADAGTYMDAQSALKIINDVMYNLESELYGQYGNAKFKEAIKLLVDPEFDFETGDLEGAVAKAYATLEKYFGQGEGRTSRSNMFSFWQDLIDQGFGSIDEQGFGRISGTVEDMAKAFHMTKDAMRAALQELEQWSKTPFDWEEIDPEYYHEIMAKAEEMAKAAAEADAKAKEAQEKAEKARTEAEEAAARLEEAKSSGDEAEIARAETEADSAAKNAEAAESARDEAVKAAEDATKAAEEANKSETEKFKGSLEEVIALVEQIKTDKLDIDTTLAVQSTQAVIDNLTKMVELLHTIQQLQHGEVAGSSAETGGETPASGNRPWSKNNSVDVPVRLIASAGLSDVHGNSLTDGGKLDVQKLAEQFIPEGYSGNVDLTNRVIVPIQAMADVGWTGYDENGQEVDLSTEGGWATLFSSTITAGNIESGYEIEYDQNVVINATPIMADGTPLSPDSFYDYIQQIVEESSQSGKTIQEIDAENLGLVLSVDVVENGQTIDGAIDKAVAWCQQLHELQEQWDQIRFENNLFGDSDGGETSEAINSVNQAVENTQSSVDTLSGTTIDTSAENAVTNVTGLNDTVKDAQSGVDTLSGSRIATSASPGISHVSTFIGTLNTAISKVNQLNSMSVRVGTKGRISAGGGIGLATGTNNAKGGRTLVGELGREVVVDPATGRWYTVGNRGPEFVNLPKHAIVFNHEKTAELLGDRKIKVGGRAMAGGSGLSGTRLNSSVVGGMINIDALQKSSKQTSRNTQRTAEATEESVDVLEQISETYKLINETLEHLIQHEEFEHDQAERAANYDGMHTALANEIEIYKAIMRNAQEGIAQLKAQGADDGNEYLQELEEAYWDAYRSMYDALDSIRSLYTDALQDEIDDIQSAFKNLTSAVGEYNDKGRISIDTFQAILNNGVEYLGLLRDENGSFDTNANAAQALLKYRKDQLAIETAIAYVNRLQEALSNNEVQKVAEIVAAKGQIGRSTWDIVYANLELLRTQGLNNEQYALARENIDKLRDLANVTMDDFGAGDKFDEVKSKFEDLNKEIEHYIEHQEFAFGVGERGMNFTAMNTALENEIAYYKQIVDEARKSVAELIDLGAEDTDEALQSVERTYWDAYNNVYSTLDRLRKLRVDALTERLDGLQSAFGSMTKAAEEYNASGGISLDTFTSLLNSGIEYMSLVDEQNGQLVVSKDRVNQYVNARKNQLAIESALSYISQVREAVENKEDDRLQHLVTTLDAVSSSTWDYVYAQAALLKTSMRDDQYKSFIDNIDKMKILSDSVVYDYAATQGDITAEYNNQADALDQILKYTEDLIRAENRHQIEALKTQIDEYKKIIDLKKESLDTTKSESEYQDEVAVKVKELGEMQAKADLLGLDTSRTASAERQKLLQDIADKQKDLAKYQQDYSIDAQKEALDKDYEAYAENKNLEIEKLEEIVSSEEKVYQLAIERIRTQWGTLYHDLIEWNTKEGSVINQEITDAWNEATKAVARYGSAVGALEAFKSASDNVVIADIPMYHSGGIVGNKGSLNENEVLAVLEKGELVVTKPMKQALYTAVDFVHELGTKLGVKLEAIKSFALGDMHGMFAPALATPNGAQVMQNNNITFSPNFNVEFNGTDLREADARTLGRDIANIAADNLFNAFTRRGIDSLRTLRQ